MLGHAAGYRVCTETAVLESVFSFANGKLTASQKKASWGGAGWFARSVKA